MRRSFSARSKSSSTSRRFRGSAGWALKSAKVVEEDDVEEGRPVEAPTRTSSPMKLVSAREASVLSMNASVLFHAYASASRESTTSMDAACAALVAAGAIATDDGEFSSLFCERVLMYSFLVVG